MTLVQITRGDGPLVLSLPHTGAHMPEPIWERLNDRGRALADTDWRVERLYENLLPDLTVVRATTHRYPEAGVHAIQVEIAQRAYLSEEAPPWTYDEAKASRLRRCLKDILEAARDAALDMAGRP